MFLCWKFLFANIIFRKSYNLKKINFHDIPTFINVDNCPNASSPCLLMLSSVCIFHCLGNEFYVTIKYFLGLFCIGLVAFLFLAVLLPLIAVTFHLNVKKLPHVHFRPQSLVTGPQHIQVNPLNYFDHCLPKSQHVNPTESFWRKGDRFLFEILNNDLGNHQWNS